MRTNGTSPPWTRSSRSRRGSRWGWPPRRPGDAAAAASAAVEDGAIGTDVGLLGVAVAVEGGGGVGE